MSKKLCKKNGIKKKDIKDPEYQCKKCGIKASKDKKLCKPEKIEEGVRKVREKSLRTRNE
jgi:hypothetical protein